MPARNGNAEVSAPHPQFDSQLPADPARVIANLCHELRTPLQVFSGYLDILSEDWGGEFSAEPLRILERMRLNAADLSQTIENLLEYAATMAGTLAPVVEAVDVSDLLAEVQPPFTAAAQRKDISLQWRVEPSLDRIRSDRRLLKSIISNLVSNAIKFTDRGAVTVGLRRLAVDGRCAVELEVVDTGIGIGEGRVEEAFRAFVQLSDSNTRRHRGLGLGLALVRRNVTTLGGTLEVRSKLSSGTCFKIRFPQGLRIEVTTAGCGAE